jgi:hypothetical protein
MAIRNYGFRGLTSGPGNLKDIPTNIIREGDNARSVSVIPGEQQVYHYVMNSTSGLPESIPWVIKPLYVDQAKTTPYTGDKRWELRSVRYFSGNITLRNGNYVETEHLKALDSDGLSLTDKDDAGGFLIKDGGDLEIIGEISFQNKVTIDDNLDIIGNIDCTGKVEANILNITSTANIAGDTNIGGDLDVIGDITGNDITAAGDLYADYIESTNNTKVGANLEVVGNTSVAGINATGDIISNSDVVAGDDIISLSGRVKGPDLKATNSLSVTGDANISNDLSVTNNLTVGDTLETQDFIVHANSTFSGNLSAAKFWSMTTSAAPIICDPASSSYICTNLNVDLLDGYHASELVLKSELHPDNPILKDGSVDFEHHQSMGGYRLTTLGTPTSGADAATKQYVDNLVGTGFSDLKRDVETLSIGATGAVVIFDDSFSNDSYSIVVDISNDADTVVSQYSHTIVNKTSAGFDVQFSGTIDSGNYNLEWIAIHH